MEVTQKDSTANLEGKANSVVSNFKPSYLLQYLLLRADFWICCAREGVVRRAHWNFENLKKSQNLAVQSGRQPTKAGK